jgi:curli biogenesis system outer membrane secretion channel CsgG
MSESLILNTLKNNPALNLNAGDLVKLTQAGVSEKIIGAMMDPSTVGAVAAVAAPAPVRAQAVPVAAPVAAAAGAYNSDLASLGCVVEPRKRILAISEFDFGAVTTQVQAVFGTNVDIGKGIMAMLTKELQQDGKYRIVERANLKALLNEQDTSAGNRTKQGSGAKIGKVLGADAYLMGTIVTFGRDDKKKSVGGGGIGGGLLGGISIGKKTDKAIVAIAYRLVDAETGEIIDTAQERGESKRESKTFAVAGFGSGGGAAGGIDMGSSNFAETIIGEATIGAVKSLTAKMSQQQSKVKMRAVEVEGRLAEVAGKNLYITTGGQDGVNKCDRFQVSRIVKEVKDPVTKETIDLVVEPVGEMVITEVRERMAIGVFQGTAAPEVNMAVRKIMPPDTLEAEAAAKAAAAPPQQ